MLCQKYGVQPELMGVRGPNLLPPLPFQMCSVPSLVTAARSV
jgi:hypothetical protein